MAQDAPFGRVRQMSSPSTASDAMSGAKYAPVHRAERADSPNLSLAVKPRISEKGSRIHWKVPLIMFGSLAAGIVFAAGHHGFYSYYDGRRTNSETQQTWVLNGGAMFAFVTKMFLCIGTAAAYIQLLWMVLQIRSKSIRDIDNLFEILEDATVFTEIRLWIRNLALLVLAAVTWCIPFAAIVTPGTITVQQHLETSYMLTQPPQLPLSWSGSQNYAVSAQRPISPSVNVSEGTCQQQVYTPKSQLMGLALTSANQRSIVAPQPPSANSSWSTQLFGPAIECTAASLEETFYFNKSLFEAYPDTTFSWAGSNFNMQLLYNAWIPSGAVGLSLPVNLTWPRWYKDYSISTRPTSVSWDPDANPIDAAHSLTTYVYLPSQYEESEMVLLICRMRNATYEVNFTSVDNNPSVALKQVTYREYLGVMSLVMSCDNPDYHNQSYNAMMWAFNNIMLGSETKWANLSDHITFSTMVDGTAIKDYITGKKNTTRAAVKATIEEMFQNMTMSLFSSPDFVLPANETPQLNTTITTSVNAFKYRPKLLWVAYGVSILAALGCTLVGTYAILRNGATFRNNFSTILRTTRRGELDLVVDEGARTGADPNPRALKEVRLRLKNGRSPEGDGFAVQLPKRG